MIHSFGLWYAYHTSFPCSLVSIDRYFFPLSYGNKFPQVCCSNSLLLFHVFHVIIRGYVNLKWRPLISNFKKEKLIKVFP